MTREKKLEECYGSAPCILKLVIEDDEPEHWEVISVSASSSGCVQDFEGIVRFVVDPTHLDASGSIDMVKLLRDAHVVGRGCSVERLPMTTASEIAWSRGLAYVESTNKERPPDKQRRLHTVMWCDCSSIRKIVDQSGARLAVVCDTAREDNEHHADVVGIRAHDSSAKQDFRIGLFEALSLNTQSE